jgi:DNA-binding NarL/FixJ family response regulator
MSKRQRAVPAFSVATLTNSPEDGGPPLFGEVHRFDTGGANYALLSFPLPQTALDFSQLTAAERSVADGLLRGHSSREIALARGRSERTIANQISAIYAKLGVRSRRELLARFCRAVGSPTN